MFCSRLFWALKLLRPRQWVKNGFVVAPLIFSGYYIEPNKISTTILAVLFFCIASSATYILNDILDVKKDRLHPKKSISRPIAAGHVSIKMAICMLIGMYTFIASAWFFYTNLLNVIFAYLLLNIAYSFYLKHQPVLDIFTIAIGFVLRVYAGAVAIDVPLSSWMFITTLCLALYLAAIKRRQELKQSGTDGRKVLEKYTASLVERYAEMSATGALIFYSLFVLSSKPQLIVTMPMVLFGLYRYWYVVEGKNGGESPTDALLSDIQLIITVIVWATVCVWALWPTSV